MAERDLGQLREKLAKEVVESAKATVSRHQDLTAKGLFGGGLTSEEEKEVEKLEGDFTKRTIQPGLKTPEPGELREPESGRLLIDPTLH